MASQSHQKSKTSHLIEHPDTTPTTQAEANNSRQTSPETSCLTLQPPTPALPTEGDSSECVYTDDLLPQIQNVVSTFNVRCTLDLHTIANKARNSEYNPKRFAALIMRVRSPRTTALIFSSGKIVCTGAKSLEDSRLASRKYARIIQKLGYPARFTQFQIQNIVGSCDVKFRIRLEGLVLAHRRFCSYEPELFPGLIYRMVQPKVVLLIFVSGKVVLTGAKFKSDIDEAFKIIYPNLKLFMKSTSADSKDTEKLKE